MQRHHGALAETDQRQRRRRQLVTGKLGIEKPLQHRRRLVDADPAFVRIAEGQREPLPAGRRLPARLRRVRRYEHRVRQQLLPGAAELDQVVTVGAVAVQKDHKLSRHAGARRKSWSIKPRAIEFSGHCPLFSAKLSAEALGNRRAVTAFDGAIISPQHPRRHGAQRPPRFGERHHVLGARPHAQAEGKPRRFLQREIARRPGIGMAEAGQ